MKYRVIVLIAATALGAAAAHAQWGSWDTEFDENKKEWKEIESRLPPYPENASLLPFAAGAASPHRFYIDAKSLSIGEDGVVRYTLVVKTAGGATNVTFEGIRCEMRQQKYYALGHRDGKWSRARDPQWRRIEYQEVNRHHGVLFTDFLCTGNSSATRPVASVGEIVQRLKYGARSRPGE